MHRFVAPALLLVLLSSCSSPADNGFLPDPPDARGTPIGPNGAFSATSSLAWSGATNELVGKAAAGSGGALIAMNAATGSLRALDSDAPLSIKVSDDGRYVVYDSFENGTDTLGLRWKGLANGSDFLITTTVGLSPHAFAVSPTGGVVAWTRQSIVEPEPESIRVEVFVSGDLDAAAPRRMAAPGDRPGPGTPVLFGPDPNQFLYHPGSEPSALEVWSTVAGTSTPFPLGLPAGARGTALRWDAGGVKALYAIGASQLWVRNATAGTNTLLLQTPGDSIVASSPAWSPSGAYAAVWTLEHLPTLQVTQARLYVANTGGLSGTVVALGTESPGAIAFSPDSRRVGYLFGTQVRSAAVPQPPFAAPAATR